MRAFLRVALFAACMMFGLGAAHAASCFWVGGTGNLNDPTHWSSGTGGGGSTCAGSGGIPGSGDTATLDALSGGGIVTRNADWTLNALNLSAFTGTFGNSTDTNFVTVATFTNTGSGTRNFNMGASTWTVTAGGTWTQVGATNLTFSADTSTLVFAQVSSASSFTTAAFGTSRIYNVVTFNAATSSAVLGFNVTSASTITTLNIAAPNNFQLANGSTQTVTTLNCSGGSGSATLSFQSAAPSNTWTMALTNASTCPFSYWRDANITGAAITATSSFNGGHNSGVTITGPTTGGGGRIIGG